jgi:hypothetical protein
MDNIYHQKGAGGMPVYYGARYQRGMGIGIMFKSFARWILPVAKTHVVPVLKDAAEFVGSEAIKTAANIATDAIDGKELNKSVKERAKESIGSIIEKIQSIIQKGGNEENIKGLLKKRKRSKIKLHFKKVKYNDTFTE